MTTITELRVSMDCPGCENTVKKCLEKTKGVDEVEIDMAMQKVRVTGCADQKKILKAVRRTGKRAEIWHFPYNPEIRKECNPDHPSSDQHYMLSGAHPQPCSSYNYYKHGYQGDLHYPTNTNSSIVGPRAADLFSDDNPNACSIM